MSSTLNDAVTVANTRLPRVSIVYCTQCKWLLRAAYYAQELLSTFGTDIGEVSLIPATGGLFQVDLFVDANALNASAAQEEPDSETKQQQQESISNSHGTASAPVKIETCRLWDRKVDGGFPETKELKRRLRDVIQPGRNLGHVDRAYGKEKDKAAPASDGASSGPSTAAGSAGTAPSAPDSTPLQSSQPGKTQTQTQGPICEDCA